MNDSLTIISPRNLAEAKELANTLSLANTMPNVLKKSPADVLAIVMAGAELGLAPMQSIRGIVLIQGRPTLSADAMGALVKASPKCDYLQCTESTAKVATFKTQRKGDPEPTMLSYTIEEAQQAGLAGGDNWRKYPKAMLRARAQSAICRLVYSDLMLGVYDPDELEAPPAEKHVESTVAPAASPPSTVETLKADLKRKRMPIVDVPAAVASPPRVAGDGVVLDWPPNREGRRIETLSRTDLEWCINAAKNAVEKVADDEKPAWFDRMANFTAELARRGNAG